MVMISHRQLLLRLELEAPVSVNALYIPVARGKMILSPEGAAYKEMAGWSARAYMMEHGVEMTMREVTLFMTWQRPQGARGDLSNLVKCLEDSFSKIVYADDELIAGEHLERVLVPAEQPSRIIVEVHER